MGEHVRKPKKLKSETSKQAGGFLRSPFILWRSIVRIIEIEDNDVLAYLERLAAEMAEMRQEMARMREQMREADKPVSETELRAELNCSYDTIYEARRRGLLRGRQIGHERFYTREAIHEWIDAQLSSKRKLRKAS
jgi:hypothetical protein